LLVSSGEFVEGDTVIYGEDAGYDTGSLVSNLKVVDGIRIYPCVGEIHVISGGVGHRVGDQVQVISDDSFTGIDAIGVVKSVDSRGSILSVSVLNPGIQYYEPPLVTTSTTDEEEALIDVEPLFINDAEKTSAKADIYTSSWNAGRKAKILRAIFYSNATQATKWRYYDAASRDHDFTTPPSGLSGPELERMIDAYTRNSVEAKITARFKPIITSMFTYAGYYSGLAGIIGGNRRIQDNEYYQQFSYVIRSRRSIQEYASIVKQLVHPAGFAFFGKTLMDAVREFDVTQYTIGRSFVSHNCEDYEDFVVYDIDDPTVGDPIHPNEVYAGQVLRITIPRDMKEWFADMEPSVSGWILEVNPDVQPNLYQRQAWLNWQPDETYRTVQIRVREGFTVFGVFNATNLYRIPFATFVG
jgi:hypothetical protein